MAAADLDLCYMSAGEAIAAFKAKSLSPVELMTAIIARIEAVNPAINALTHTYFERALGHLLPLLDCTRDETVLLPALKINVESAPLSHSARLAARRQLTPHFLESYGTVEASLLTLARPADQDAEPDSVGRVIAEVEAEVTDRAGDRLATGEVGEIRFRGKHFPTSYQGNAEATARAFRDGWFYPGDLASINSAGYVFLKGRSDDVINNEGAKFYPIEVENILLEHPAVREVAVSGWPHARFGTVAIAFVVASSPIGEEDLQQHCLQYLAAYKTPHHVIFITEMPRNPSGKILKRQLKADLRRRLAEREKRGQTQRPSE
ncbi:MAG: AMP-binding protein [Alphaproteobacteria bacterium]|jgi:acyl-CoA synthetase (AMP-forming)/AMP-acid ligase II|nr:AMP-binding protein [Alphaproteobacteria bacterium]